MYIESGYETTCIGLAVFKLSTNTLMLCMARDHIATKNKKCGDRTFLSVNDTAWRKSVLRTRQLSGGSVNSNP